MPAYAPKRTHADAKRMCSAALGYEPSEIAAADTVGSMTALMGKWQSHEDPRDRLGLDVDDLLAVAIAQESPLALRTWLANGAPVNADTLLAVMTVATNTVSRHIVYANWGEFREVFMAPSLAPWHGSLFAHAVLTGAQDVAQDWIQSGLIGPTLPIPSTMNDAPQWLWSWDCHVRNELDATLPLHLCVRQGRWELAELLWSRSEAGFIMDGRGATLMDEFNLHMEGFRPLFASKAKIKERQRWQGLLESTSQAHELDSATIASSPEDSAAAPRRL